MKVFASKYLEKPTNDEAILATDWKWIPSNSKAINIYASGNSTSSRQSTYAAERDDRSDTDRPNEGMYIA